MSMFMIPGLAYLLRPVSNFENSNNILLTDIA